MPRTFVTSTHSFNGPAVQYMGEDGFPAAVLIPVLVAEVRGELYQLPNSLSFKYDDDGFQYSELRFSLFRAQELEERIRHEGVDLQHWVKVTEEELTEYLREPYFAGGL